MQFNRKNCESVHIKMTVVILRFSVRINRFHEKKLLVLYFYGLTMSKCQKIVNVNVNVNAENIFKLKNCIRTKKQISEI